MINLRKVILNEFAILPPLNNYSPITQANNSFGISASNNDIVYVSSLIEAESIIELVKLLLGECTNANSCAAAESIYNNSEASSPYDRSTYYAWICPHHLRLIDEFANDNHT